MPEPNESYNIAANSDSFPNEHWWVAGVGLLNDKLFVSFRNGDTAYYQTDLATAKGHLANLRATNHPGRYVNFALRGTPYTKIPDPEGPILDNQFTPTPNCVGCPGLNLGQAYTFIPNAIDSWFAATLTAAAFTADWTDPNLPPARDMAFYNNPFDDQCTSIAFIATSASPFTGPTAGALKQIFFQYHCPIGGTQQLVTITITDA